MNAAIARYKQLAVADFADGQPIALSALVKLESDAGQAWYFIGPTSGGIKVEHEGRPSWSSRRRRPWARSSWAPRKATAFPWGRCEYEVVEVL